MNKEEVIKEEVIKEEVIKEEVIKEIRSNPNLTYADKVQLWNDEKTSRRLNREKKADKFSLFQFCKRTIRQTYNLLRHGNRFYIKPQVLAKTDIQPDYLCLCVKDELEKHHCKCKTKF